MRVVGGLQELEVQELETSRSSLDLLPNRSCAFSIRLQGSIRALQSTSVTPELAQSCTWTDADARAMASHSPPVVSMAKKIKLDKTYGPGE